jgi:hypothetical protein
MYMSLTKETITPLHRMAAVLNYLDGQPASWIYAEVSEVRRLLVGDLERPAYVAMPAAEARWLRGVRAAAEVAYSTNWGGDRDVAMQSLGNQLRAEPKDGAV